MKKISHSITNLLLIIIAISVPIVIADQYMRSTKLPRNNARVMLLSGGKLDSSRNGIRSYTPNSSMSHSAVYGDVLEYSYDFETDENGFRITYECRADYFKNDLVAITGDSFTEGQGSNFSWISSVQKQLCEQGSYSVNTSMAGYGLVDMDEALKYAHQKLGAKRAIVAIIPENIYRNQTEMTSNKICSMYGSRGCGKLPTWWHHSKDLDNKSKISFAQSKYDFGIMPILKELKNKLKFFVKSFLPDSTLRKLGSTPKSAIINQSIAAMDSIVSRYGVKNTSLIILPTKKDIELSGSLADNTKMRNDLNIFLDSLNKKILVKDLRDCPLEQRHFFKHDSHLNEEGHKRLGICAF